jgi:hypothetical protein
MYGIAREVDRTSGDIVKWKPKKGSDRKVRVALGGRCGSRWWMQVMTVGTWASTDRAGHAFGAELVG